MLLFSAYFVLVFSSLSQSFLSTAAAVSPQIATTSGTYSGVLNATTGLETFKGIRFAQPPVGSLRFAPPVPITNPPAGIQDASQFQNACPQLPFQSNMSEDCLWMNIYRPPNLTSTSGLPIVVWFFGEYFVNSAASAWDGSSMVQQSINANQPIIWVSFNYRLDVLGFLAGSEVPAASLNAGLLDQRLALEYVAANAKAIGGDASKITLFGHSAGATSVGFHMLFPSSSVSFRAAIMNSGAPTFQTVPFYTQYDQPGQAYPLLTQYTNCTGSQSFSCLQNLPLATLFNPNAQVRSVLPQPSPGDWQVVWYPSVGPSGSFIDDLPSVKIANKDFLRIPFISGTVTDEGTMFSTSFLASSNSTNTTRLNNFVLAQAANPNAVSTNLTSQMAQLYPISDYASIFNQASQGYGDGHYLAPRRLLTDAAAPLQNVWSYQFEQPVPGFLPPPLGVFHSIELIILEIFAGVPGSPFPTLTQQYSQYYINFINNLNPGSDWPLYQPGQGPIMQFLNGNITAVPDNYHIAQTNFWNEAIVSKVFER